MDHQSEFSDLGIRIDDQHAIGMPRKRRAGLGRWVVRGFFVSLHVMLFLGFLAWADGRLPRLSLKWDKPAETEAEAPVDVTQANPPG